MSCVNVVSVRENGEDELRLLWSSGTLHTWNLMDPQVHGLRLGKTSAGDNKFQIPKSPKQKSSVWRHCPSPNSLGKPRLENFKGKKERKKKMRFKK